MSEIQTVFSGVRVDRCGPMRSDADAMRRAYHDPDTRFVPIWRQRCLVSANGLALLRLTHIAPLVEAPERCILLGRDGPRFLFATRIGGTEAPFVDSGEFAGLRELTARLPEGDVALLAYARAMVTWQHNHQFCGVCGDPAIIVLASRDSHCLLGRQAIWPEGRFSTIAGFVEPGESLEDAVRREVYEETNIRIGRCRYLASQPWPFPAALMLGFHAEAISGEIRLNDGELAEARWLSCEEIGRGAVILPPAASIAYRLIEAWFDAACGESLSSLGLAGPMIRRRQR
jgi:NAD+ diphosphatase